MDALADHPNQTDKSPYAYAWNNPINLTDPDGNCPECPSPLDIWGKITKAADNFFNDLGAYWFPEEGNSVSTVIATSKDLESKLEKVSDNTIELVPGVSTLKAAAVGGESTAEVALDIAGFFPGGAFLDDAGKGAMKLVDNFNLLHGEDLITSSAA